jgi:hypothetical protein
MTWMLLDPHQADAFEAPMTKEWSERGTEKQRSKSLHIPIRIDTNTQTSYR